MRAGHDPLGRADATSSHTHARMNGTAADDRNSLRRRLSRTHARTPASHNETLARTRGRISGRTNGRRRIPFVFAVRVLESLTRSSARASARVSVSAPVCWCTLPLRSPSARVSVRVSACARVLESVRLCVCVCVCVSVSVLRVRPVDAASDSPTSVCRRRSSKSLSFPPRNRTHLSLALRFLFRSFCPRRHRLEREVINIMSS